MKILKVTDDAGVVIYINQDKIRYIYEATKDKVGLRVENQVFYTKESITSILDRLRNGA